MKQVKAAIFDLDGTIIDTLTDLANSGNMVLENHGLPTHPVDSFRFFVGSGIRNLCIRMLPEDKKTDEEYISMIFNEFNETYGAHYMDNTCAFDGMEQVLEELKRRNIKVAILTNKGHEFTIPMVKKVYGDFHFDLILGKTDKFPVKPNKELIMHVINSLEVGSKDCIYLGDSNVDMYTAKNGNIEDIIGVSWGFRPVKELLEAGAKYIINNPSEIIDVVDEINNN